MDVCADGIFGLLALLSTAAALEFPGPEPGTSKAKVSEGVINLGNEIIAYTWSIADGKLKPTRVRNLATKQTVELADCEVFRLTMADGHTLAASEFEVQGQAELESLPVLPAASISAQHFPGQCIRIKLATATPSLEVEWRAILRDGANAIRQEITLLAKGSPVQLKEMRLVELPGEGVQVAGTVPGSPLVKDNLFFAYEHPDTRSQATNQATSSLILNLTVKPGEPITQSSVAGAVADGQLRRGFLYYVERERAHPYRPFLHYNAWYDICWGNLKIDEAQCLAVIEAFGQELIEKRKVPMASFVWDDGWDDPKTLWRPLQANFPNGFTRVLAAAQRYNSTLGFWLSPFGGYGKPQQDRLTMGKAQGFETGPQGFSLAGPKYYARFLETCSRFIVRDGANFFKFDGLARSVDETEAMLRLTRALRAEKPDLFISITTGTWPSPFWLWYGDSTWRGGGDMGFHGPGSKREQWITYRDMETYRRVVRGGPLYPINSLMNQGFAHARYGSASEVGNNSEEIRRELRSLFGGGTCLQELYVTPGLMTPQNWDDLAECALWARHNTEVLVDTHWVGGDPGNGEVYGWASWSPSKGILALRNPSPQPASITLDIGRAFELPRGAPQSYRLKSPWQSDRANPAMVLKAESRHTFQLEPFGVLVFDALAN